MARVMDVSRGTLNGQTNGFITWNTSSPGYWMYHVGHLKANGCITWNT